MVNDCGEVSSPQTLCAVSGLSAAPTQLPEENGKKKTFFLKNKVIHFQLFHSESKRSMELFYKDLLIQIL